MSARRLATRAIALALSLTGSAVAHPLEEGTARITLRDGHVDVVAEWDLFALVAAPPTTVATCDETTLGSLHDGLRHRIETETALRVDGTAVPLSLTGAPDRAEFRALAAQLSAAGQEHGARVRLRLESARTVQGARRLSLRAPAALGPVVVSFVQPASRYLRPGSEADFEVLVRPPATRRSVETSCDTDSFGTSVMLAFLAGIAAFFVSLRIRTSVNS